jgi:hypothetical protein
MVGVACGIAFTVFMVASGTKEAQAEEGVPYVEFDTTYQHCTYVHTGGIGVSGALSCTARQ